MIEKLSILRSYWKVRYSPKWHDRSAFERWQEARVRCHLDVVRRTSAFYRHHWAGRPITDWRTFPTLDKSRMMEHFDRLNTAGIRKEDAFELAWRAEKTRDFQPTIGANITVGLSSGTSGSRGLFLVSPSERLAWTGAMLAKVLPASLLRRQKIAFFLRANSNLYATARGGTLQFQYFDLLKPLEQHLQELNHYRPSLLVAPASVLRLLADAAISGELRIQPDKIISVAEVLDPLDRRIIGSAFGQTVHQIYQCTEGFLAATCSHGTLHLNEDLVCIQKEYVDEALGKFIPIITDFSRFTQPIVRYKLNDLLTECKTACPCGSIFTAIAAVEGRCDDLFYFPASHTSAAPDLLNIADAAGTVYDSTTNFDAAAHFADQSLVTVYPDFIARSIIGASAEINAYKVIQHAPDRIEIQLQIKDSFREAGQSLVSRSISDLCNRLGCRMPHIAYTPYHYTPGDRKLRRVERRFML